MCHALYMWWLCIARSVDYTGDAESRLLQTFLFNLPNHMASQSWRITLGKPKDFTRVNWTSYDPHQMMLAELVKRLHIVTAEFVVDLGSILRWRKPIVLRLGASTRHIWVKNTSGWSTVAFCACEIKQSYFLQRSV